MDLTLEKVIPPKVLEKKKNSPSSIKRNSIRKKSFLEKKSVEKLAEQQLVKSPATSLKIVFKCNQCEDSLIYKDAMNKHTIEKHSVGLSCLDWDHTSKTTELMKEHVKENHTIEQLDGFSELQKSTEKIEHDELWCHKCEDQLPTDQR